MQDFAEIAVSIGKTGIQRDRSAQCLLGLGQPILGMQHQPEAVQDCRAPRLEFQSAPAMRLGLGQCAQLLEHQRQIVMRIDEVRLQREHPPVARLRILRSIPVLQQPPEVVAGQHIVRLTLQDASITGFGASGVAEFFEHGTQVVMRRREIRVEQHRLPVSRRRLSPARQSLQHGAQVVVRHRIAGLQRQRLPVTGFGLVQPPGILQRIAQVVTRFGVIRQQGDGFLQRFQPVLFLRIERDAEHLPQETDLRVARQQPSRLGLKTDKIPARVQTRQTSQFFRCRLRHLHRPFLSVFLYFCHIAHQAASRFRAKRGASISGELPTRPRSSARKAARPTRSSAWAIALAT